MSEQILKNIALKIANGKPASPGELVALLAEVRLLREERDDAEEVLRFFAAAEKIQLYQREAPPQEHMTNWRTLPNNPAQKYFERRSDRRKGVL